MLLSATLALALAAPQGTLTVDAGRGPVTVHIPAGYDPADPAPLIVLLHGFTASGALQESYMRFRQVQDQYGFLYCTPDGTQNSFGQRFWNATDACCDFTNTGVDDSGYLRSLIEAIEAATPVDPRSIHLIGHSNGGFMAYRMACDHPDKIASIASLAGATFDDPTACAGVGPVHVLQIHGTADGTIQYGGGAILGNAYPGALETVTMWAMRNGCDPTTSTEQNALNLDNTIPGPESSITRFPDNCASGGSVELWTIPNGGHSPGITPAFRRGVVEHLLARPKAGLEVTRYCSPATSHSSGIPARMTLTGSDVLVDDALVLGAEDMPLNTFGFFLTSRTQGLASPPTSQGDLCLGGDIGRFSLNILDSGMTGSFALPVDLAAIPQPTGPVAGAIGETWNFQAWFRDANPGVTSNFTDAVTITLR